MVERIRTLLEARQLTPTQFADAIGVARPIVSHILSGRNKPSLEVVQRILAAMPELSMAWLLNGTGPVQAALLPMPTGAQLAAAPQEPLPTPRTPATTSSPLPQPRARHTAPAPGRVAGAAPPPNQPVPKRFTPAPNQQAASVSPSPDPVKPAALPTGPAPVPPTAAAVSSSPFASPDKPIRRIVIFYRDGTFADYQPEQLGSVTESTSRG